MNISFAKPNEVSLNGVVQSEPSAPATAIPSTSALVIPQVLAVSTATPPVFFDDDNIPFEDVIVPRLNCVQKVGDLSEIFAPGELVLNQTTVVHVPANKEKNIAGSGPLVVIPIGFKKSPGGNKIQFAEKVEGGGRGLFVNTEAEVVANNGTLDWKEWDASTRTATPKRRFERYTTCLLLFKQPVGLLPDEEHQIFTHLIDAEYYALALMGMKGTWFTGMAKQLFTARKIGHLKGGYSTFSWTLTTTIKPFPNGKGGTNYAAVPILGNGPKTSPALLEYVRDGLGFGS